MLGAKLRLICRHSGTVDTSANSSQDTTDDQLCDAVCGALNRRSDGDGESRPPHRSDAADPRTEEETD